ncbi:MAG: hypothetical protein WBM13_13840 [Bacteroidia bacterium]
MAAETLFTANTGLVTISTANTNLDGTGTLGTVLTAASSGTNVKSVTIKAVGSTTAQGMVRLFVDEGAGAKLIAEVEIPIVTQSSADEGFEIYLPLDLDLQAGAILKASTQIANTFNIIAEGLDWTYNTNVRPESTNYIANTNSATISVANSNLDGTTGTVVTVFTAGSSATYNGCKIKSIVIKGVTSSTTDGMIRLFIQNTASSVTKLFTEIPVPIVTPTATARSFAHQIDFPDGGFNLQAGYKILATTQNANTFAVTVEGMDWKYPTGDVLGYVLYGQLASIPVNPADATTYYFGSNVLNALRTTGGWSRLYIPTDGVIDSCYILCLASGTFGSAETSSLYIRLNNSTDTLVSSGIQQTAAVTGYSNTSLNIAVSAGNYIEFKYVTASWATNPLNVSIMAQVHVKTNL